MNRYMVSASALVLGIAALKTGLMTTLVLDRFDMATVTGLFALFTVLTAGVAYVAFTRVRAFLDAQRKKKLVPGQGEAVSKEAVIQRYSQEWGLSKAESEVALLAAKGFSNNEIAEMRGSSVPTIKTQLGSIYQKSQLDSRYQLIAFITDEVCEMAIETDNTAASAPVLPDNVKPLVKKTPGHAASLHPSPMQTSALAQ